MIAPHHPHEPLTAAMFAEFAERWPDPERLAVVFALALDVDTAAALLEGRAVDPSRIDRAALAAACRARLVQLVRPVDLLPEGAAG